MLTGCIRVMLFEGWDGFVSTLIRNISITLCTAEPLFLKECDELKNFNTSMQGLLHVPYLVQSDSFTLQCVKSICINVSMGIYELWSYCCTSC